MTPLQRIAASALLALSFTAQSVQARGASEGHELSVLSALPVAVSISVPAVVLSGTAVLTVVAVEASAEGTVWIVERASDGVRASITLTSKAVGGVSVAAGTVVRVTAIGTGWVLSAAGEAIAFVPNEIGKALVYNERISR